MFLLRILFSYCIISGSLFAMNKEQCSQSLVSLLEANKQSKIQDLFKQCAAHGTPEQQLTAAKTLAQALKKQDVEKTIDLTMQEMKQSEESQGLSWWQWFAGMWACLGICVASQKAIEDYYEQQSIDEENEELREQNKAKREKIKRKQVV